MTKRAWWLVGLNLLIPGSAQVLAGNRKLGRFGLGATITLWVLLIVALVVFLVWPTAVYTAVSTNVTLWIIAAVLAFYAALWVVLTLDTLRLVRIVKTAPSARVWLAGLATVAMVAVSGTAAYGAYVATSASSFLNTVFVTAPPEPPVDGRYNIMLLGADDGPDRDGLRPDSISVVSIDAETGAAVTIGLPRDMEEFPFAPGPLADLYPEGYGAIDGCEVDPCMLNSVYTEVTLKSPEMYPNALKEGSDPGIEGMRDAVSGITGLTIQYYVLIDMQGFATLIDALGGVTITVPEDIPIHTDETFTVVGEWIYAGEQHLDGYHALWYARSRHDTSDYDRMARQRQIQDAILQQFTPANILSKFQAIADAGEQVVHTDIPQASLGYFVNLATKTKQLPVTNVELVPTNGVDPQDLDIDYVRQLVAAGIAAASPTPALTDEG